MTSAGVGITLNAKHIEDALGEVRLSMPVLHARLAGLLGACHRRFSIWVWNIYARHFKPF